MNISILIRKRRTIRKYRQKNVPLSLIKRIINSARYAPSPHNTQPWEFVVVKDRSIKNKIANILKAPPKPMSTSVKILIKKTAEAINNSPVVVLVYNNAIFSRRIHALGEPYVSLVHHSEIESIGAAIQNMQLVAASLSIGMAWVTFPLLLDKWLNKLVKEKKELVAVLTIGYPDEIPLRLKRNKLKDIIKII